MSSAKTSPTLQHVAEAPEAAAGEAALNNVHAAIVAALEVAPVSEVLSVLTGAFVGLVKELVSRNGQDPDKQITIEGAPGRNIVILEKTASQEATPAGDAK